MTTRKYRILAGHTFRDGDRILSGGDTIELPLDMYALHRDKVELIPEPEPEPIAAPAQVPAVQASAQPPVEPAPAPSVPEA